MRKRMTFLEGYFDGSGSYSPTRECIVVGGFLAQPHAWQRLRRDWVTALAKVDLSSMHMADFMASAGVYESWRGRDDEKGELLLRLATIIGRNTQKSFCEQVEVGGWHAANAVYQLRESRLTPYAVAAFTLNSNIVAWWNRRRHRTSISFTFEAGDTHQTDFGTLMGNAISLAPDVLSGLKPSFKEKAAHIEFQAADFVAWAARRSLLVDQGNEKLALPPILACGFQELARCEGKNRWGGLDEDRLVDFCLKYDVPKRGENRAWRGFEHQNTP